MEGKDPQSSTYSWFMSLQTADGSSVLRYSSNSKSLSFGPPACIPRRLQVLMGNRLHTATYSYEQIGLARDCLTHTGGTLCFFQRSSHCHDCFLTDCETLCPLWLPVETLLSPQYLSLYLTAGPFHFFTVIKNSLKCIARAKTCTYTHSHARARTQTHTKRCAPHQVHFAAFFFFLRFFA